MGLIFLYFTKPDLTSSTNPLIQIIYLGTGMVLMLWGLRAMAWEFFPWASAERASKWGRYRVRMPRQALVYILILLALFMGALLGRSNMLMFVFGLMAGPFVLNGWITLSMLKHTHARRSLPECAVAGELFSVDVRMHNRKHLFSSWMTVVQDRILSVNELLRPAVLFVRVPPQQECSGTYQVRLMHRGVYEFGPLQATSRFPLGLMERSVILGQLERLVVYPRVGRLTSSWKQSTFHSSEVVKQQRSSKGTFDDEFHSLHEYRPGDNPRAIHWRTTARRNTLIVRDFHQDRDQDLLILLDLWAPEEADTAHREAVELAISFAATMCVDHCQQTRDSTLTLAIAGEHETRWEGLANRFAIDPMMEQLALARPGSEGGLLQLACELSEACETNARKILITTRRQEDVLNSAGGDSSLPLDRDPLRGGLFQTIDVTCPEMETWIQLDSCE